MSALLRLLERHPRVLERLQQEQAQILAQHGPALTGVPCCLPLGHARLANSHVQARVAGGMLARASAPACYSGEVACGAGPPTMWIRALACECCMAFVQVRCFVGSVLVCVLMPPPSRCGQLGTGEAVVGC